MPVVPSQRSHPLSPWIVAAAYLVLKAALYRAAGLFDIAPNASAWYPPIGLMLAFVLHSGWAAIPFLFIPSDLLAYGTVNSFSLLIIPQAMVVGATGLMLRRRVGGELFGTSKGVGIFVVTGFAAVSVLFVITTATVQLITARKISIDGNVNFAYWLGDLSGLLLGTPIFLVVFRSIRPFARPSHAWLSLGGAAILPAVLLSAGALLLWFLSRDVLSTPASSFFLLILPIAIAGFLWGFGASTLTAFLVNVGLVLLARGVLDTRDVVDLQVFMLAAGTTGLLLGALGSARMDLLRRNANLLRAIEEAPLGIALLERRPDSLHVTFANATFQRANTDPAAIAHRLRNGQGYDGDVQAGDRTFNWTVKPASSAPSGDTLIVLVRDVTEQRRREQAEQHQRRMVAIGEIAGGLAHELNNLLHPVINLSRQARKDLANRPERLDKALGIVEDSARSAVTLVRQVLSFARNDEGTDGATELVSALRDSVALLTSTLPPTFAIAVTHDVPSARVNLTRTEISQVVTNLVVNALDATGQKGRIDLHVHRPVQGSVTLTVEDDGPGVPRHERDRIMEPFFTTKPHGRGTGLGLAVVHDLLVRRGGTIDLVTQAPQGARFVVRMQSTAE